MNIHKELEQLRRDHKLIADRIDEIEQQLEPEITEGQYWKTDSSGFPFPKSEVIRINSTTDKCAYYQSINSRCSGNGKMFRLIKSARKLSTDEVEQALIKEAKRRGFDDAEKWRTTWNDNDKSLKPFPCKRYEYSKISDSLFLGGVRLYKQGNFAEIIEDEWEVKENNIGSLVVTNGAKEISQINNPFDLSKKEAQAIANALNNLDK